MPREDHDLPDRDEQQRYRRQGRQLPHGSVHDRLPGTKRLDEPRGTRWNATICPVVNTQRASLDQESRIGPERMIG
jgi:hypothetical protein